MAITTLDGVIAGCKPPQFFYKALSGTLVAGRPYTPFYAAGIPGAAVAPTPGISGAALTSYAGQIPFTNPTGGQSSYLARFVGLSSGQSGQLMLVDRLWHNSGITITSNSPQTVNSVTFPARDQNGSTNGEGVLLGVEVSTATGSGTPSVTVTYTNSDNVGSKTGATIQTTSATSPIGTFYPIGLASGDKGVRSIQSLVLSTSWTSGTIHLVAYRVLSVIQLGAGGISTAVDVVTGGMPQMFDNTVPFLIFVPSTTTSTSLQGSMTVTQG
jgi:hypothetical protein